MVRALRYTRYGAYSMLYELLGYANEAKHGCSHPLAVAIMQYMMPL